MEHFYFDLDECGTVTTDPEGREASDLDAARTIAMRAARGLMCEEVTDGRLCLSCHIDIRSADGALIERVRFKDALSISGI